MAHFRAGQIRILSLTGAGESGIRKVLHVSRDRDGTMWVATDNGLSRITNRRVATLTEANGLPAQRFTGLSKTNWLRTGCTQHVVSCV